MAIDTFDIGTPIAYRAITCVASTGFTAADLVSAAGLAANTVIVSVKTNVVNLMITGADATALIGHTLPVGTYIFKAADFSKFRFMDTGAGASVVQYTTGRK